MRAKRHLGKAFRNVFLPDALALRQKDRRHPNEMACRVQPGNQPHPHRLRVRFDKQINIVNVTDQQPQRCRVQGAPHTRHSAVLPGLVISGLHVNEAEWIEPRHPLPIDPAQRHELRPRQLGTGLKAKSDQLLF